MDNKQGTEVSLDGSNFTMMRHKVIVVGDVAVGKTSIINGFLNVKISDNYTVHNLR
jgi:GTPase SAR1 family protein